MSAPANPPNNRPRREDRARRTAFDALRAVNADGAYANLILPALLRERGLSGRDAAFATELLANTCRWQGSYDMIIAAAAGRPLTGFQPAVLDLLRLGVHQILAMRNPRAQPALTEQEQLHQSPKQPHQRFAHSLQPAHRWAGM